MQLRDLLSRPDSGTDDDDEIQEQHAEDLEPRGESRQDAGSYVVSRTRRDEADPRPRYSRPSVSTDVEKAPDVIEEYHREFYVEFALGQAALSMFDLSVSEPGWSITAEIGGEKDEDMTDALEMWGKNCAIHAGESGQDIMQIVSKCPSHRRSKGTLFVEKVRSRESELGGVMMLDPSTMSIYKREDQNLVVQPNDDVEGDHPTTPDAKSAAYVQYDGHATKDEIAFAEDEIIKLAYNVPEGRAWGQMIWRAIRENIRRLRKIKRDRGASIRLTGWPHLIYGLEGATQDQAQDLADAHDDGNLQAKEGPKDQDDESSSSRVGRTDYVNHQVNVEEVSPDIPDVGDAIMDEIEEIFSVMPVSKPMVAYAQDINQWVIEPLERRDDLNIDDERRYLESKWEPLFEEKADELAGGSYEGDVRWRIEQPKEDNPLLRGDFDPERLLNLVRAHNEWPSSFSKELFYHYVGMNREEWEDEIDDAAVERAQEIVAQAQAENDESDEEAGDEDELEEDDDE
ncbi:hypothetical protein [Halostagnicola sp. A-GB9-2]|uniref:hypothetical protein n=1 Tax=Halostagnicola sp. A-GB9-2 TaxID=3048066 RepID=UPI0024BF1747|nr:hypothetical protein [Halostagnicola sp. A-GB9-2]MDJ1433600.1 hypothetical protein [Halostagnicola sp. A-GB9-2]